MRHAALGAIVAVGAAAASCAKPEQPAPSPPAARAATPAATPSPTPSAAPTGAAETTPAAAPRSRADEEACVDRWLAAHKLDAYGHPEGTMYAGGTPLFDERTGETRDRLDYVYVRQPGARQACRPGG